MSTALHAPRLQFPFCAVQGQAQLQMALLLAAIDPALGGVLIQGPRGTAKSTCARGLAELLPQGEFVELPLGASEEQLIGSLDIETALKHNEVQFKPGLLSRAHQGVLYVDEVNLLPDALVDVLLDVSASGINRIERDGISHQHDARLVLVGTMNPEEGTLRPQLLDRFGLFVDLQANIEPSIRQAIVRARMNFDADPERFQQQHSDTQNRLKEGILRSQTLLAGLLFTDQVYEQVSSICHQANVEGVRADLTLLRASRAHAAWHQREQIASADILAVCELVLAHRRKSNADQNAADPAIQPTQSPDQHQAGLQPQPQQQQEIQNSGPEATGPDSDWGEMPAQVTPISAVKNVKPLPLKK